MYYVLTFHFKNLDNEKESGYVKFFEYFILDTQQLEGIS